MFELELLDLPSYNVEKLRLTIGEFGLVLHKAGRWLYVQVSRHFPPRCLKEQPIEYWFSK